MSTATRGATAQDDPEPWPPVSRAVADPVAGGRRTVVVANCGDDVGAATHLAALGGRGDGRVVVVRPTPGADDLRTLGLDVLVAAGKRPGAAKAERVAALSWEIARAWLRGGQVADVVVDRAHRLTGSQSIALAGFAAEVGASLWLIWGGRENPAHLHRALAAGGRAVEQVGLWELRAQLPAQAPIIATGPGDGRAWPVLPAANFTTFLAVCRRHLTRAEFGLVAEVYYDTAEATDAWLGTRERPGVDNQSRFAAALTGWLRDVAIGPAPTPAAALVRLRAVQAALFTQAIVLGWEPAALGPEPARRLLGDLTVARSGALRAGCRTDAAAATALSLHLNLGPTHFELLRIGDAAPDGSAIRPPTSTALHRPGYGMGSNPPSRYARAMLAGALNTPWRAGEDERVGWGGVGWGGASSAAANRSPCPATPGRSSRRTGPTGSGAAPPRRIRCLSAPMSPGAVPSRPCCARRSGAAVTGCASTRRGSTAMTAATEGTSGWSRAGTGGWSSVAYRC